ncbi:MAG: hypothetical protein AMXMBFR33_63280 [Candidatus Xenobia bacterium]
MSMQPVRLTDPFLPGAHQLFAGPQNVAATTLLTCSDGRCLEVPLDGTPVNLGRRSSNELVFEHPRVSRQHAQLKHENGSLWLRDRGSRYGTLLDGKAIEPHSWVRVPPEAELTLGQGGPSLLLGSGALPVSAAPLLLMPSGLPAASSDPMITASSDLTRRTVGWSDARPGPHQSQIELGLQAMDRLAPGFREKLDQFLDPTPDPVRATRIDELSREQMDIYASNGKLMAMPPERLSPAERLKREALDERVTDIQDEGEILRKHERTRESSNLRRAEELCGAFLKKLREAHSHGENVAGEAVSFDQAALDKLAEKGITPDQVRGWVNDFFHQTGLPVPRAIKFRYLDDRPRYMHESGVINVGSYFDKRVCLHELAHRLEFVNPSLSQVHKGWVAARSQASGNAPGQFARITDLCPAGKYEPTEMAQEDHFIHPYVGKVYGDQATEVLSTGLEHFTDGKRLLQLYRQDPEHFFLVLGAIEAARGR